MRAPPTELAGYGSHIYAYCNVRTNQVLYSLKRNLDSSALKQLPDVGANYTPPKIRPDLWKPLYSVTVPSTEQGLRLFRKLKEWRKLHELNWEPPSYLSRPYTEKEIEELKEKLENRGGSKKETVFDVIKRKKKKMRQNIIMNQKANSIADLAAVLIEQEEQGVEMKQKRDRQTQMKVHGESQLIIQLAKDAEQGGLKKLDDEIQMMKMMTEEGVEGYDARLLEERDQAVQKRDNMTFAMAAVREAKAWMELSPSEKQREENYWKSVVESSEDSKPEKDKIHDRATWSPGAFVSTMQREYAQSWQQVAVACRAEGYEVPVESKSPEAETVEQSKPSQVEPEPLDYTTFVPCLPPRLDPTQFEPSHIPTKRTPTKGRASRTMRKEKRSENAPVFTAEGVKVEWANFLDAEFAGIWPEAVQHERMGGKQEKLARLEKQREERQQKWDTDLAEMVEMKRKEMGLSSATEAETQEDMLESAEQATPETDFAAAEDLQAKEAAAMDAAIQALKQIRNKRRLPPRLQTVQSEILDRVRAKMADEESDSSKGGRRPQELSSPTTP